MDKRSRLAISSACKEGENMGALDFLKEFEGRAIDAASYNLLQRNFELQESNASLLKDKVGLLEKRLAEAEAELSALREENQDLRSRADSVARETAFHVAEGIAFRRGPDGKLDPQPYCPSCYTPMGNPMRRKYVCPSCQYIKNSGWLAEELAEHLNKPEGTDEQDAELEN
ncbi:hypothetical protein ACFLSJ_04530 [Verrucomicrobiota bacterium]